MASSALKVHLHASRKIVNDSHTFLLRDFPDLCCDCFLQFTNCLRIVLIHIILEIPPQIKIWGGGFKSGECATHSISHFLLISLSLNRSLSQARESFVVWGMAPSCRNHCSSRSIHLRRPNDTQNFISTAT